MVACALGRTLHWWELVVKGLSSLSTMWKRQVETGLGDCRMALEIPFPQTVPVFDNTSTLKIRQSDSIG